nr:MAG TPA: hypothetical protein [Caudoviricetes sp.]
MHGAVDLGNGTFLDADVGNEIIESILSCLSRKNLTAQEAKYLLGESADEVDRRAKL